MPLPAQLHAPHPLPRVSKIYNFKFSDLQLLDNRLEKDDIFVASITKPVFLSLFCPVRHKVLMNSEPIELSLCREFDDDIILCQSNDHLSVYRFFSHDLI